MLYEIPNLKHIDVQSIKEAIFWLHEYGTKAKVIAGGTDLLSLIKDRLEVPEVLVNIKPIIQMKGITYDKKQGLKIGAAVTLHQLQSSEVIEKNFPILGIAARHIGTTQIRNMGTIGGNIFQRPQCVYFRNPDFLCRKKGGDRCYAMIGEHRDHYAIMEYGKCAMAHPSDMAPPLIALKAKAIIAGRDGVRQAPLEDLFLRSDHSLEIDLQPDELLVAFQISNLKEQIFQCFFKHRIRKSFDFALASIAVSARISDKVCEDIRIVIGGVAPFPYLNSKVLNILRGKKLTREIVLQAAEASVEGARPLPMNRYKIDVVKALVERALISLLGTRDEE